MTKNKLALVIVALGAIRIISSVVSQVLGAKAGISTLIIDLLVALAIVGIALVILKPEVGRIYLLIFGGGLCDLAIRCQYAYGKFIQVPFLLDQPLSAERRSALLSWSIFELLPGAAFWITTFVLVSFYFNKFPSKTSPESESYS